MSTWEAATVNAPDASGAVRIDLGAGNDFARVLAPRFRLNDGSDYAILGYGVDVVVGSTQWTPLSIGVEVWFDASDLATMRQDRGGASATVPAAVGSPVGSWFNKGLAGGWATAPSDAARPILRSSGGLYWLEFDGVDDYLALPAPAIGLTDLAFWLGYEQTSATDPTHRGMVVLAPSSGTDYNQADALAFDTGDSTAAFGVAGGPGLSLLITNYTVTSTSPSPLKVYEFHKDGSIEAELLVNGASIGTDSSYGGFAASHSGDLIVAARFLSGVVNAHAQCNVYQIVIANIAATNSQKTSARDFVVARTGAVL